MKSLFIYLLPIILISGLGSSKVLMGQNPGNKESEYKVVINHEEQYSIWPSNRKPQEGWKDTRISGNQNKCQKYIKEVWTDMRPLSIRKMKLSKNAEYHVVINHEEQYSIWPAALGLPKEWKTTDIKGGIAKCTDYIDKVWTDMRPLSLRESIKRRKN